jgi:hypothetical protein
MFSELVLAEPAIAHSRNHPLPLGPRNPVPRDTAVIRFSA